MNRFMILSAFIGLFICLPVLAQDEPGTGGATEVAATPEGEATPEVAATPEGEATPEVAATPEGEATEALTDEIETFDEAAGEVSALVNALQSKNWPLAVGLFLTLLVFVANKLGLKNLVGSKAVPWVAMAISVFGTVGTGLIIGLGWVESLTQGILTGVAAIGGWELIFKNIFGKETSAEG